MFSFFQIFLDRSVRNWLTLSILLLLCLTCHLYFKNLNLYWKIRNVPYEKPYFLAGSLWNVFSGKRQIGKHLGDLYKKFHGPYFGIFIFGKPYLVLRSPEIIKNIAIRDFNNFQDRSFACDKNADDMSGNSLFIIKNPDWRNIRNKLSGIFTSGKLKNMFPLMLTTASQMEIHLEKYDNQVVEMKEIAGKYMTDLVAKCFFGLENNSFQHQESEFRKACIKMFDLDLSRSFSLFSYFFIPKFVSWFKLKLFDTTYLRQVFLDTLSFRMKTGFKRNDFVDLLIQCRDTFQQDKGIINGTKFDTTCMVAQAITFFMAGFETTSNLLGFALYELSLRQLCQEKLRQEILETFQSTNEITFEKIQQMKYLDMVIAETLRRYPFGPFLNRYCKEDYVIEQTGLKIEKGTPILIPLDGIHFDPEFYKDPELFEPERFANGYKHLLNSCVYMPFGIGPRNCIGDRFGQICAKVGLVYFLRKFKVEKCDLTQDPIILDAKSPFMTPVKGLQLRIRKL
ncbi:unnamed protein product [Ceutorhynchus assimilis]|uniref:Cytochrome P450 n=1 Tax=Ceutorhynchus assimilis TaxID=467358 RepID=A0A9N9MYB8_9CUCU|nr:unnamed protein product [Ceutorhynchus assimilis]